MRFRLLFSTLLVAISVAALEIMPGGFIPSEYYKPGKMPSQSADAYFLFRKPKTLFIAPNSQGKLKVELHNTRIGRYQDYLEYMLFSPDGTTVLRKGKLDVNKRLVLEQDNLPQGVYRLYVNAGQNASRIAKPNSGCCTEASSGDSLTMVNYCPTLYFLTAGPKLAIKARGEAPNEHIALTIRDNRGGIVYQADTLLNNPKHILCPELPVPPEQIGKVWSMKIDRAQGKPFEDMDIAIIEGASPLVAFDPSCLLFAAYSPIRKHIGNNTFVGLSLCPLLKKIPGASIDLSFTSDNDGTPFNFATSWKSTDQELETGFTMPFEKTFQGDVRISLSDGKGKPIHKEKYGMAVCESVIFTEIVRDEPGEAAKPTALDQKRGFQLWQREEPGFIRSASRPAADEIRTFVKAETNPGLISAEFFAIQPLKAFDQAILAMGPLTGPNGETFPAEAVEVMPVKIWSQRTDWNAKTYINAPELIEHKDSVKLKPARPQPFCIRVKVPQTAVPGLYKGSILFNGKVCLDYELTVHDFTLPEYDDMTFGLYADGERWHTKRYTDEEVMKEYKMFRDYGMNALVVYPFTGSHVRYDKATKKWDIDFDVFRHHMQLYVQAGFNGVLVVSLQAAPSYLVPALKAKDKTMTPELASGYRAVFSKIKEIAQQDKWPAYCLHTIDEPHRAEDVEEAVATLKLVHDSGFKSFNTCFGTFVRKYLAPYLDYRCYNQVGFMTSPTKIQNDEYKSETLAANSAFWWYGSGCYTNCGLMQDCNIYSNRHMLGIFNFRSGASGAWTWTFLRAKGDIFNDFDHNNSGEAKDACICYPTRSGNGLIDTLQWEACREGIYDYRYLRLWADLVKQAKQTPDKARLAAKSEKNIGMLLDSIPWTCMRFSVDNGDLRRMRATLIREINILK